jgi:hypothetical protein
MTYDTGMTRRMIIVSVANSFDMTKGMKMVAIVMQLGKDFFK